MPVKACHVRILVDEYDFSGVSNSAIVESTTAILEYSVFQNCAILKLPDTTAMMMEHNGFFTAPDAGQLEAEMYAKLGTTEELLVAMIFGTLYDTPVAYVLNLAFSQQLRLNSQTAALMTVSGSWHSANGLNWSGYQIHEGVLSATGPTTAKDFVNSSSDGGKAFLFVKGIFGTPTTITIKVQGYTDASFASPVDLGTFSFSESGAYQINLASTVHRHIRLNLTSLGGADSVTVVAIVCSNGVTY